MKDDGEIVVEFDATCIRRMSGPSKSGILECEAASGGLSVPDDDAGHIASAGAWPTAVRLSGLRGLTGDSDHH